MPKAASKPKMINIEDVAVKVPFKNYQVKGRIKSVSKWLPKIHID